MRLELDPVEIRVLGSLIEKDLSTPDYYPMTLNGLLAACNQRSNRDPVMHLSEAQVLEALDALMKKYLAWEKGGAGSRVPKYAHKLSGTLTKAIDFSRRELGALCVLMLRGPQTPGEIRARSGKLYDYHSLSDAEHTLKELSEREDGPYVVELPREAGRRESRYAHLFGGPVDVKALAAASAVTVSAPEGGSELVERVSSLEDKVSLLVDELEALKKSLGD